MLAKTAAKRAGALEAWLVDPEGFVTEGGSTNAWIVDAKGDVVTRPLGPDILPGVTRQVILEAAKEAGLRVVERSFTVAEAKAAREAFLSSASGAAVPVVAIDGQSVGDGHPGPLTLRIQALVCPKSGHHRRLNNPLSQMQQSTMLRGRDFPARHEQWANP